jgi:hypothetical protein
MILLSFHGKKQQLCSQSNCIGDIENWILSIVEMFDIQFSFFIGIVKV